MRKKLQKWLIGIMLDGQNSEIREIEKRIIAYRGMLCDLEERFMFYNSLFRELSDRVGNCYICQSKMNELERRTGVSEAKLTRLKQKLKHLKKEGGIR